jgi:ribonuclease HI
MQSLQGPVRKAIVWATGLEYTTPASTAFAEAGLLPLKEYLQWRTSTSLAFWKALDFMESATHPSDTTSSNKRPSYTDSSGDLLTKKEFVLSSTLQDIAAPKLPPPWAKKPRNLSIILPATKEEAKKEWATTTFPDSTLEIYTDGSKTEKGVGAGWYYVWGDTEISGKLKLSDDSSVFRAEVTAITKVLGEIKQLDRNVHIFTDSRATVMSLERWDRIVEEEMQELREIIESSRNLITIQWIPGHCNIPGNETVDTIAKEACELDQLPVSLSPTRRMVSSNLLEQCRTLWSHRWMTCKSHNYFVSHLPSTTHVSSLCENFSLANASTFVQFRAGHTRLNQTLFRFRKAKSANCACGEIESTQHVLLHCWIYEDIRRNYRGAILGLIGRPSYANLSMELLLDCRKTSFQSLHLINAILNRRKALQQDH